MTTCEIDYTNGRTGESRRCGKPATHVVCGLVAVYACDDCYRTMFSDSSFDVLSLSEVKALAEALPLEVKRVRELSQASSPAELRMSGPLLLKQMGMIRALARAERALAARDVLEMFQVYTALREF
jgi:hypothetical protein